MKRLLRDYLVESADESGVSFSLICTVCGKSWTMPGTQKDADDARDAAAHEAMAHHRVCQFCGRPVCSGCFEEVEGVSLCVQCGGRLRQRINSK